MLPYVAAYADADATLMLGENRAPPPSQFAKLALALVSQSVRQAGSQAGHGTD